MYYNYYRLTFELQLLTDPLNVHSVNNMGIVFVPMPASIVKTIDGIVIKQTSLLLRIGNVPLVFELLPIASNSNLY